MERYLKLALLFVILEGVLSFDVGQEQKVSYNPVRYLMFRNQGSSSIFNILVFADLLYGNNQTLNNETKTFQYNAISKANQPIDLVVLLGNAVDGT